MKLVTQILPEHHKHCDDLFVAAEDAMNRGDWAAAEASFDDFAAQMAAHFAAEEDVLFPAFETASGMSGGPTQMMRFEHEQMRQLLKLLEGACKTKDANEYGGIAETLLTLLQQHNMKEENILYPMCEQALGGQAEQVVAKFSGMLKGGHA